MVDTEKIIEKLEKLTDPCRAWGNVPLKLAEMGKRVSFPPQMSRAVMDNWVLQTVVFAEKQMLSPRPTCKKLLHPLKTYDNI